MKIADQEFPDKVLAVVIPVDTAKPPYLKEVPSNGPESAEVLRELVGGWIERPVRSDTVEVVSNEESRLENLGCNTRANKLIGKEAEEYDPNPGLYSLGPDGKEEFTPFPKPPGGLGLIHGPAVFIGPTIDFDAEDTWVQTGLGNGAIVGITLLLGEQIVSEAEATRG